MKAGRPNSWIILHKCKIDTITSHFPSFSGIVEFLDSGEAKKAFRNLAYSKFKSMPLYLEWAPVQVFKTEFVAKTEKTEEEAEETEGIGGSKGIILMLFNEIGVIGFSN